MWARVWGANARDAAALVMRGTGRALAPCMLHRNAAASPPSPRVACASSWILRVDRLDRQQTLLALTRAAWAFAVDVRVLPLDNTLVHVEAEGTPASLRVLDAYFDSVPEIARVTR